ncbi:ribonuclease H-like domain-containing protein [Baffinella frigidus]|nr:ribonuclease H-like domain-containing protein [Cryptophyta sp. CCMP2293]
MTPLTVLALVSLALSGQVGAVADVRAVTVVATPATVSLCRSALSGHKLLALDCEGVNLGRRGEISLIQLATPEECFLLDVQDAPRTADVVALAKEILEDESVCKIIHDCKADSDALSHLLG